MLMELKLTPHEVIAVYLMRLEMSQKELAQCVNVHQNTIIRVLRGEGSSLLTDSILKFLESQLGKTEAQNDITTGDGTNENGIGYSALWGTGNAKEHNGITDG
jgi:transcriptional regulator with XRE-family HTH domain